LTKLETPEKLANPTSRIVDILKLCREKGVAAVSNCNGSDIVQLLRQFQEDIHTQGPLNISEAIKSLEKQNFSNTAEAIVVLQEIGHTNSLDITQEIKLLREIKDIQDELNIMSILFEDQRKVLKTMESIIHSMSKFKQKPQGISRNEKGQRGKCQRRRPKVAEYWQAR